MAGLSVSAVESIAFFQETIHVTYLVYVGHLFSSHKSTRPSLKKLFVSKIWPLNYPPFCSFYKVGNRNLKSYSFDIPDGVFYQTFWKISYSGSHNCKSRTADNLNLLKCTLFC